MKLRSKGFTLIELLVASVIVLLLSVIVYRYWIKQTKTMSDSVAYSSLKERSSFVSNGIIRDLKEIAYNPMSVTEPTTNKEFDVLDHPSPYDSILYSFYNADADPSIKSPPPCSASCTPDTTLPYEPYTEGCWCTRAAFFVENNVLKKKYYDENLAVQPGIANLLMNACARFIFWDSKTNAPCDPQGITPCSDTIKIVLASLPTNEHMDKLSSTGCLDINPDTPCCEIPKDVITEQNLNDYKYFRLETKINLTNLSLK